MINQRTIAPMDRGERPVPRYRGARQVRCTRSGFIFIQSRTSNVNANRAIAQHNYLCAIALSSII